MSVEFIADESVDFRIVEHLRENGIPVLSVKEEYRGSSDKKVLQISRRLNRILITEDSDFGEWVFAHQEKTLGILFLRYRHDERSQIAETITAFIQKQRDHLPGKFSTITLKKVRIREI